MFTSIDNFYSGVARISGQGAPKKSGGGGTSNKMKTEKKETKYVHVGAPINLFNCKTADTTNVKLNKRF
jgi:hypothetical protein